MLGFLFRFLNKTDGYSKPIGVYMCGVCLWWVFISANNVGFHDNGFKQEKISNRIGNLANTMKYVDSYFF